MISARQTARYRQSLKSYLGYRASDKFATLHNTHSVNVLADLLNPDLDHLDDFMTRYPRVQRPWRRREVIQVICQWLGEIAAGLDQSPLDG